MSHNLFLSQVYIFDGYIKKTGVSGLGEIFQKSESYREKDINVLIGDTLDCDYQLKPIHAIKG